MNAFKELLLNLYRVATYRSRQRWLELAIESQNAPVSILFYHRVADKVPNGWTMGTEMFLRQIDWLAEHYDFVSLEESQARLQDGNQRPAIAITFDDGYADNCDFAIPLLLRREIPFTYFVSTQIIKDQTAFEHDLAAGTRLGVNSIEQIRAMADAGVEIGAHTRTHANMGRSSSVDWIREELLGSVDDLQDWIKRPIRYFAFPFGLPENMTREAVAVAVGAGLKGICSAYGAYNFPAQSQLRSKQLEGLGPFHLRRIHADPEWARFLNWMTFDPRKVNQHDLIDDNDFLLLAGRESTAMEKRVIRV